MKSLSEITREVAKEWADAGKLTHPPDTDKLKDDDAFWAEVEARHVAQTETVAA